VAESGWAEVQVYASGTTPLMHAHHTYLAHAAQRRERLVRNKAAPAQAERRQRRQLDQRADSARRHVQVRVALSLHSVLHFSREDTRQHMRGSTRKSVALTSISTATRKRSTEHQPG